jgi:ATP-dependent RNA/DNA helicase IGHMBP2
MSDNKPINIEEYVENLKNLLKIEEEYEKEEYEKLLTSTPIQEKIEAGLYWKNCEILNIEHPLPNRSSIELQKKKDYIEPAFSNGSIVRIFKEEESIEGTVTQLKENIVKILFYNDEIPDFLEETHVNLEMSFSELTYKSMYYALDEILSNKNPRFIQLRDCLIGNKLFFPNKEKIQDQTLLNNPQNSSLKKAINSDTFFVLHGPPGTGKTYTLVEIAEYLIQNYNEKILFCAASNIACDVVLEKAIRKNLAPVRLGNPARISEHLYPYSLEAKISTMEDFPNIQKYRKKAHDLLKQAHKFKRKFGKKEREERQTKKKEAYSYLDTARKLEDTIYSSLLDKSRVIVSTLTGIYQTQKLKNMDFDTIIIDEATQALEPSIWLAILLSPKKRLIFAGDPFQLSPTVKSPKALENGFSTSLLEKLLKIHKENDDCKHLLSIQYRMNNSILEFPNKCFYEGKLISDSKNSEWKLPFEGIDQIQSNIFVDTAGTDYNEEKEEETESLFNIGEVELTSNLAKHYLKMLTNSNESLNIGILSPYKSQVKKIREKLLNYLENPKINLSVDTIDSFQGSEKDIIIISLVRSNDFGEIGFLEDVRRMNVALTRAKKELVVIGNSETIKSNPFYKNMVLHYEKSGAIHTAWEFIDIA